jgi:hypothetical protein
MRPIFRLTLAAALVMFVQDSAGAASLAFCNTYAQSAMEAVRANADNNCNFSGQRYTSNPQTHLNWCLSQDEDDVNEENGKRWRQVNACSDCRAYARQAADDAHKNAEYGCGFSGPAWGENGEGHFAWCFNGRIDAHGSDFTRAINFINQERQNRRNKVEQCKAQFSQEELAACQAFADAALVQAKSARAQASKLQACALTISNGDWHEDWDGYFGQCLHDMREARPGSTRTASISCSSNSRTKRVTARGSCPQPAASSRRSARTRSVPIPLQALRPIRTPAAGTAEPGRWFRAARSRERPSSTRAVARRARPGTEAAAVWPGWPAPR